jgi:hypothetical protein
MQKNVVQSDRTLRTIKYDACALHAGSLRIQTQIHTEHIILHVCARKQWFREGASMLRWNAHCLSCRTYRKRTRYLHVNGSHIGFYNFVYVLRKASHCWLVPANYLQKAVVLEILMYNTWTWDWTFSRRRKWKHNITQKRRPENRMCNGHTQANFCLLGCDQKCVIRACWFRH